MEGHYGPCAAWPVKLRKGFESDILYGLFAGIATSVAACVFVKLVFN